MDDGFSRLCARGAVGSGVGRCRSGNIGLKSKSVLSKKVRWERGLERRGKWESWEERMRSSCQRKGMVILGVFISFQ